MPEPGEGHDSFHSHQAHRTSMEGFGEKRSDTPTRGLTNSEATILYVRLFALEHKIEQLTLTLRFVNRKLDNHHHIEGLPGIFSSGDFAITDKERQEMVI